LYSEDIFYCFKLANINRFVEIALLHTDALTPSRTFYLQDLSGSYDITSTINPWFGLPPLLHLRHLKTSTVRVRATAQLLFLLHQQFLSSVVKKL
jgi:hypothetical protein